MAVLDRPAVARPLTRRARRDAELLAWLRDHPASEVREAADALRRSVRSTHQRLLRLETHGLVQSAQIADDLFVYTVYSIAPEMRT